MRAFVNRKKQLNLIYIKYIFKFYSKEEAYVPKHTYNNIHTYVFASSYIYENRWNKKYKK